MHVLHYFIDNVYVEHLVQLLTYVPGTLLAECTYTPHLLWQAGKYVGFMDNILKVCVLYSIYILHTSLDMGPSTNYVTPRGEGGGTASCDMV